MCGSENSMMDKLPFQGEKVELTALHEKDLQGLLPFFNDIPSLAYYLPTTTRPFNAAQLHKLLQEWNDGISSFVFAIRSINRLVGLVNLDDINWADRHAEIGIALLNPQDRGRGFAADALETMTRFAFGELGLHRLWARIVDGNSTSVRLFERAGFQLEGRLREHVRKNGRWVDMLVYGLISHPI